MNADEARPSRDGAVSVDLDAWEPGEDVDADALVAAELTALRSLAAAVVSVEQVAQWAGTNDPDQLEQIIAAIPFSSIPDALAEIAEAVANAEGRRSG
ncbi:hypothetical protein [Leifsonia shinshuensis]